MRGATAKLLTTLLPFVFQPTRPLRGATPLVDFGLDLVNNFNPRAPCGARPHPARRCPAQATFQPTRPCGARLFCAFPRTRSGQYFNPRALAGRDTSSRTRGQDNEISTHAPLRGATNFILMKGWSFYISTHAPLAGRDIRELCPQEGQNSFQPTRPCGARLSAVLTFVLMSLYFNPRALAGRDVRTMITRAFRLIISTHAPLRGATPLGTKVNSSFGFQPTRPLRGATAKKTHPNATVLFQPTRPCGARPDRTELSKMFTKISTHAPLRGATSFALLRV